MKNQPNANDSQELTVISEIPIIFDSNPEAKNFLKFINFIKENHPKIGIQENEDLRSNLKIKIPPLQNVEEFKKLYEKCFLSKIKFNKIDIFLFL